MPVDGLQTAAWHAPSSAVQLTPRQRSTTQTEGDPEQAKPASRLQRTVQPSPLVVLPSSQTSPASITLLPQTGARSVAVQMLGSPTQPKLGSTKQAELQPSLLSMLPSSHRSPGRTRPSPQRGGPGSVVSAVVSVVSPEPLESSITSASPEPPVSVTVVSPEPPVSATPVSPEPPVSAKPVSPEPPVSSAAAVQTLGSPTQA